MSGPEAPRVVPGHRGTSAAVEAAVTSLSAARFVPVLRAPDASRALGAARALAAGGCQVLEVAFTTPDAARVIETLVADGHFVGAGTVLDVTTAREALAAGASFLVSPHLDREVAALAARHDILYMPGALTPTEVVAAHQAGAPVVKVFPVGSLGGPRYLQLLRDPLPFLRFFPTGGVVLDDLAGYLAAGAVAVGVGSALAPAAAIAMRQFAQLEALARQWRDAAQRATSR